MRHPDADAPRRDTRGQQLHDVGTDLPLLTGAELRAVALKFPKRKGYIGFHPRWFAWLSDAVLDSLAALLNAIEDEGVWPGQVAHIVIILINKRGGGRRPIWMLEALVRVWERARKPVVQAWRAANVRDYDGCARGRRVEDVVWVQALHDEIAAGRGQVSSTALLDLTKAFESARLDHAWKAGIRYGYPLRLLRLSLEAFAFERHVSCQGACASGVRTLSAILAGSTFASDVLYLLMLGPCDRIAAELPNIRLGLVVDDLSLQSCGN